MTDGTRRRHIVIFTVFTANPPHKALDSGAAHRGQMVIVCCLPIGGAYLGTCPPIGCEDWYGAWYMDTA